jgi:putative aminopeptidase FrvX
VTSRTRARREAEKVGLKEDIGYFSQLVGPSGAEDAVIRAFRERTKALGYESSVDPLGNVVVGVKEPEPGWPRIMVSAHLDEIGFVVRKIEAEGYLRVHRVGGIHDRVIAGQRLVFLAEDGSLIEGCVGVKGRHVSSDEEAGASVMVDDAYVDVMEASAEAVRARGLDVGSLGTYVGPFVSNGDLIRGKALDNRVGVALLLELSRRARSAEFRSGLTLVATVQEEFSVRGGVTAARAVDPDFAICLDIAIATDTPDSGHLGDMPLGGGAVITRFTHGTSNGIIPNPKLHRYAASVASAHDITFSYGTLQGGLTDASYMQYESRGVPTLDLSFPTRYAHSPVETCHMADVGAVADLTLSMVTDVSEEFSLSRG